MRVLNTQQMRDADRRTIDVVGVPSTVLMENAGRQVVAAIDAAFADLATMRVAVLCGRGNNGGDGFVVARTFLERRMNVGVYLLGRADDVKGDARLNLDLLRRLDATIVEIPDARAWELHGADAVTADLIVDAMFGTGFTPPVRGIGEMVINDLNRSGRPVVSIDLPSGVSADTASIPGPAVRASLTVTLAAPKVSLLLPPTEELAGKLVVAEIGVPQSVIRDLDGPWIEVLTPEKLRPLITPRREESHKGTYGRVLVIAGSRGKTGAAALAGIAALRSGAGLVTIATPESCLPTVAALAPEYMTEPLDETPEGSIAERALSRVLRLPADVIAIGPGLGSSPSTVAFVHGLVERTTIPVVVDADGLNAFAGHSDRLVGREGIDVIITPHPGEMARLVGKSIKDVQAARLDIARDFATAHRVHVVLKGHRTLVVTPAGKCFINATGNPGMATGGTGDVLTGVIAGWFAQLLDAESAAGLGVYLHGLAGDLAAGDVGETALIASDVVSRLGAAVLHLTERRQGSAAS